MANEEVLEALAKINDRIDKLKKFIESYLFMASEMQVGTLRTALKNV